MSPLKNHYDASQAEASDSSSTDGYTNHPVWANGTYELKIGSAVLKENFKKTGHNLVLGWDRVDGTKRRLFQNLTVDNPSQQAMQIARGDLKEIVVKAGLSIADFDAWINTDGFANDLLGERVVCDVTHESSDFGADPNGMVNRITAYQAVSDVASRAEPQVGDKQNLVRPTSEASDDAFF